MVKNAPSPGNETVPSARAERRRSWSSDTRGVALYAAIVAIVFIAVLGIVIAA